MPNDENNKIVNCKHQYEECCDNGICSVICHSTPSKHGCPFNICCDLDKGICDGDCTKHVDNLIKDRNAEIKTVLYDALSKVRYAISLFKEKDDEQKN